MSDKEYFSHLYEIASDLNKEYSLHSALRKALERTVELLRLETGWIWLVQSDVKSVYLAASYNLPPALGNHPERLSGWCYCIEKYLSDDLETGRNISEITCSRLKNITAGTRGLKFHASIPITTNGQKTGLINLVSKETQQLDEKELAILNTISELIGMAIQRTRVQDSFGSTASEKDTSIQEALKRVFQPQIRALKSVLDDSKAFAEKKDIAGTLQSVRESLQRLEELQDQLAVILEESHEQQNTGKADSTFHYPSLSLTKRELEVLNLVKKGYTNLQVAEQLFISERTVKFHITSILSKLFAKTRTEAVNIALQRGLLGV